MNRTSRRLLVAAFLASVVLVTGCNAKPRTDSVVVEEDIITDDRSTVMEWVVDEIVPVPARKPAALADKRPSKNHIWVPGEWKRDGSKWLWESGRWRQPPVKNASWLAGHWRFEADKWHWTSGHWVVSSHPHYLASPVEAPAPLTETRSEKPSDHHHWIAGYWDWDGHWYWIPGYWTTKPHPDAEWVAGHWDEFGFDGGYRWIGGHWRAR